MSKRFHALALRIFYNRLSIAAGLNDHTLLLECYHPSARLFAGQLYCHSLGTAGLETALDGVAGNGTYEVGKIANLCALYSRFRPQHKEPERRASVRHRAGDIPGSRTYPSTAVSSTQTLDAETRLVSDTVSLDAHELFSQLCTVTNLVKMGPKRGLLLSIVEVGDGTIRVWRDWLAKQAEARVGLIDTGEPVIGGSGSFQSEADPTNDPSILWVNNSDNAVGIKFRVRKHQWRRDNPILFSSEEEVAVSYQVEFEGTFPASQCSPLLRSC